MALREDYKELVILQAETGSVVVAPITYRDNERGRLFSFSLMRELPASDAQGEVKRTCWLHRRHVAEIRRLLDEVENRLEYEERRERMAHRPASQGAPNDDE